MYLERGHHQNQLYQSLDLGLPSLQSYEKEISDVSAAQTAAFRYGSLR